jgi:hypothetical protein
MFYIVEERTWTLGVWERSAELNIEEVVSFSFIEWSKIWVHLVNRPLFGLLYQPRMTDDEFGAVVGTRIVRGNRSSRRKPISVQIPHDLTWVRTRATAVGRASNRLSYGTALREKVSGGWRKLQRGGVHNLLSPPDMIRLCLYQGGQDGWAMRHAWELCKWIKGKVVHVLN